MYDENYELSDSIKWHLEYIKPFDHSTDEMRALDKLSKLRDLKNKICLNNKIRKKENRVKQKPTQEFTTIKRRVKIKNSETLDFNNFENVNDSGNSSFEKNNNTFH